MSQKRSKLAGRITQRPISEHEHQSNHGTLLTARVWSEREVRVVGDGFIRVSSSIWSGAVPNKLARQTPQARAANIPQMRAVYRRDVARTVTTL
jgi:hypothetical protein